MGTKRHMAGHVRDAMASIEPKGRVVDLFSGMGSVAESLQDTSSVITNDALAFTSSISRARFTGRRRSSPPAAAIGRLRAAFESHRFELERKFRSVLRQEDDALAGSRADLHEFMASAQHVGNSRTARRRASTAAARQGHPRYQLATLYFSAGYLSTRQAIEVDALRFAIDEDGISDERDWLLAAWISGLSTLVNAPGHTAQYLRPNTPAAHARIVRTWKRSVFEEFTEALARLTQVGTSRWRAGNEVFVGDALDLVSADRLRRVGVVYADPPYTKDQYSRYYHVYETLYHYDFPDSIGQGRTRSDRFSTGFCLRSSVVASFHDLCRNVARLQVPLVISYPSQGLLQVHGHGVEEIAQSHFAEVHTRSIQARHSTLGASSGRSKKLVTENLYVCLN